MAFLFCNFTKSEETFAHELSASKIFWKSCFQLNIYKVEEDEKMFCRCRLAYLCVQQSIGNEHLL